MEVRRGKSSSQFNVQTLRLPSDALGGGARNELSAAALSHRRESARWPGHLIKIPPRCWRDCISYLAWGRRGVPEDELESMAARRDVSLALRFAANATGFQISVQ